MIRRGNNFKQIPINIAGSSVFGRYPKINIEKTYNMFVSDNFLVNYAGYKTAIPQSALGKEGRASHSSTKLGQEVIVIDNKVFLANITFNQSTDTTYSYSVTQIGTLLTISGICYITENNKPQILISDNVALYLYDPTLTPSFQQVPGLNFTPGFIDFHDTYFLCSASNDQTYSPAAQNTWRLSAQNNGLSWPSDEQHVGLLETKPDNTQAVVRFPSRGNMIVVMGQIVSEFWFDVGAQLFPYQRNNQMTIDYGCLSPATIASMDEIVVWLASNEKTGPIIMYSTGGMPEKITTDGIDFLFAQMVNPSDSRAFLFRQDGHLLYHINFYTDNLSLVYDFNTKKIYHASDENLNFFIGHSVSFFNNQYYFVSKNNGNLYAFDTIFTTYDGAEIPRIRTCKNVRLPSQEYFIANDIGFTIEQGETNYQQQDLGDVLWLTEDGIFNVITETGGDQFLLTEDSKFILTEDGLNLLILEQMDMTTFFNLIFEQRANTGTGNLSLPHVDLSVSYDGGASFSNDFPYYLNPIGSRKNKLMWWQGGIVNDFVPQFKFWGLERFVCTDGILNIRQ